MCIRRLIITNKNHVNIIASSNDNPSFSDSALDAKRTNLGPNAIRQIP